MRRAWVALASLLASSCVPEPVPNASPFAAVPPVPSGASAVGAAAPPTAPSSAPSFAGRAAHVPEGTYKMGSEAGEADERPVHDVHVAAFDLDLTEVTVADYARCVKAGACTAAPTTIQYDGVSAGDHAAYDGECNDDRPDRRDHPENCVDWTMANAYCAWAGKRLPTEEQWEYAACGGNCDTALGVRGSASTSAPGAERWPFTRRVGLGKPGPFGTYDMAGNVWEWTASPYCPYDHPGCSDKRRVIRGGSWSVVDYLFVRLTDRSPADPANRNTNVGFRCAK